MLVAAAAAAGISEWVGAGCPSAAGIGRIDGKKRPDTEHDF